MNMKILTKEMDKDDLITLSYAMIFGASLLSGVTGFLIAIIIFNYG